MLKFKSSLQRDLDRFYKEVMKSDFNIREVTKGKTRYIRALFVLLPMGIFFTYHGLDGLLKSPDDLPYTKGIVSEVKLGSRYSERCKCRLKTYFIYIEGYNTPFITSITQKIEAITEIEIKKGDAVEIWVWDKTKDNLIEQLIINGEMIIPYNRTLLLYSGFLVVGLVLVVICIGYLKSSASDLFGRGKE